jgi:hypothetical protein
VTTLTNKEAAKLVFMAASVFPGKQETDLGMTAKAWMMILSDIPYQVAEAALIKVLSTAKFFPTPAEIREAALNFTPGPPSAENAWKEVREYISSGHNSIQLDYNGVKPEWSHSLIEKTVNQIGLRDMFKNETPGILMAQFIKIYNRNLEEFKDRSETERVLKLTNCQGLLSPKEEHHEHIGLQD